MNPEIRCLICGKEYIGEELGDILKCPNCGTKSIPCAISDDVNIKINWHELRILVMWAEQWASEIDKKDSSIDQFSCYFSIMTIAERLQRQFPDKTPLTMFGEVRQLRDWLAKEQSNATLNSDFDDDSKLDI